MAVFASPLKPYLIKKLHERNGPTHEKSEAITAKNNVEDKRNTDIMDSDAFRENHPVIGLPGDLGADVKEAVKDIREEFEAIRGSGEIIEEPTVDDMKLAVESKLGKKISF